MVVMTSWAPIRAFISAGMKAHAAPARAAARSAAGAATAHGRPAELDADERGPEAPEEQLPLGPDVEEPSAEAVGDSKTGEDERCGPDECLADLPRAPERTGEHR